MSEIVLLKQSGAIDFVFKLKNQAMKKIVAFLLIVIAFSSCSTLTKTQRMERDMFNPAPTRTERKQIKQSGVNQDQQNIKMPKRR